MPQVVPLDQSGHLYLGFFEHFTIGRDSAAPYWIAEHKRYKRDQEYLGLGLFVLEKTAT